MRAAKVYDASRGLATPVILFDLLVLTITLTGEFLLVHLKFEHPLIKTWYLLNL
jgi:hypothetical protein